MLNVLFMGTPDFAKESLEAVYNAGYNIIGVVTNPDRPKGRGMKMIASPVKEFAIEKGLNVYQPERVRDNQDFINEIKEINPDIICVVAYGKILPLEILNIPRLGSINVHGSLLPKYRWASPLQTVFLNNEEMSWITIMHMDAWMDTGAIINKLAFKIPFEWTVKDLIEKFEEKWPEFLNDTLWDYAKWEVISNPQNKENATYCQKITKQDWEINPYENSIESIYAKYRWYYLWPKIWFTHNEKKVVIEELVLDEVKYNELKTTPLFDWKSSLNACIKEIGLKPEGKKAMDFKSFKNGYLKG